MAKKRVNLDGSRVVVSISSALDSFILDMRARQYRQPTIKNYAQRLGQFVKWCSANDIDDLSSIDQDVLRKYRIELVERDLGEQTIFNHSRDIRAFLRWCKEEQLVDEVVKFKMPPLPKPKANPYSDEEVDTIYKACKDSRERLVIAIMLDTGVRPAELSGVLVSDIDLRLKTIHIRKAKMRKSRHIAFSTKTLRELNMYAREFEIEDGGPLFPSARGGGNLSYSGFRWMFDELSRRCGFSVTMYRFRDTFATNMIRTGTDLYTLSKMMGHDDPSMLKHYVEVQVDDIVRVHAQHSPVERLLGNKRKKK